MSITMRKDEVRSAVALDGVEKIYQTDKIETVALDGINLSVERGESISTMGPSGSGKSTLLDLMGLLDTPSRRTTTGSWPGRPSTA